MRIKLTISYIGTNYSGWQSQKNRNAVQDKVETALSAFFGGTFIRTYAAGRTDVGVHAEGQVVHFDVPQNLINSKINPYKLCLGVNLSLPSDISVANAQIVDDSFDARFSAVCKTYVYKLYISPFRNPFFDINRCQIYRPLNVPTMKEAALYFVGTHDFAAFQSTGSNLSGTVRTIYGIDISEGNDSTIDISVCGNAFLYNMVRIMCGTLVKVGKGEINQADIPQLIAGRDRKACGKTLPAVGLTLRSVQYKCVDGKYVRQIFEE